MRRSLTPQPLYSLTPNPSTASPQPLYSLTPNPSPKERGVITAKG